MRVALALLLCACSDTTEPRDAPTGPFVFDGPTGTFVFDGPATAFDASVTPDAPAAIAQVRLVGRWDTDPTLGPRANFSGSGLVAAFHGTGATLRLEVFGTQWYVVSVDGGTPNRFTLTAGSASKVIASGLPNADHTVAVTLDSEGMLGYTRYRGLDVNGTLLPAPAAPALKIEVVGDSISCGYGNLGTPTIENQGNDYSAPTCGFSPSTESAYMAYGSVLGRLLGAEATTICWSGKGVYEDLNGSTDMPTNPEMVSVYKDALLGAGYNNVDYHEVAAAPAAVDAVVVNLGTNDISGATHLAGTSAMPPEAPFKTAYLSLIHEIRARSPSAHIFVTLGSMVGDPQLGQYRALLDGVIAASGDNRVHRIDVDVQDVTQGVGCDWHPTRTEDARIAAQLAAQMKNVLGVTPLASDPNPL